MQIPKKIESKFRKALYDFELITNNKIIVALSGGQDSLALLLLLHKISNKGFINLNIFAIHIKDVNFCNNESQDLSPIQKLCTKLNIKLIVKEQNKKLKDLNCYSCSRARRKMLFQEANKLNIKTIAFGHHKDDNVQTLILNLFHKGEFAAMLPKIKMHLFDVTIIRPLIYISKNEISHFISPYKIKTYTCNKKSYRTKVKNLLDEISCLFPNIKENLSKAGFVYGSKKASFINSKQNYLK